MMELFLENCSLSRCFLIFREIVHVSKNLGLVHENCANLNFRGPAGGEAPGRRFAPKSGSTWLVETDKSEAQSYSNTL